MNILPVICRKGNRNSGIVRTVLLLSCLYPALSRAQQAKGTLQLADRYFAAGEYYTAAGLYKEYLHSSRKKTEPAGFPLNSKKRRTATTETYSGAAVLLKQAHSYRLAHYWPEAAAAYHEYLEKEKDSSAALYWYAVCQRTLGDYHAAAGNFQQYLAAAANKPYREEAEKELQTIAFIRQQFSRADTVLYKVQKLNAANSSVNGLFGLAPFRADRFLVSSTTALPVAGKGVNPYYSRLFYATMGEDSLEGMTPLSLVAGEPLVNQGAASMSADGNYLYFTQWKKENGRTVSAIYYATKLEEGWTSPVLLASVHAGGYSSKQPFCSPDGKYLFFSSDRPGGAGNFDIWYALLNKDGSTGKPVNAGMTINTAGEEQAPFYHMGSGTLVFSSDGRQGMGGYDLFSAKGNETTWEIPVNMGYPVNSVRDDIYFSALGNTALLENALVGSDRGWGCCLETYRVSKEQKNRVLTGIVFDRDKNLPLPGAVVIMKDRSGKIRQTTTDGSGKYVFDLGKEEFGEPLLSISKELYRDTATAVQVKDKDEADPLTDTWYNTDIYIVLQLKPKPVLQIKAENVVTVYFDFDKSNLKPEAVRKLDSVYRVMLEYPSTLLQVSGYTDGLGTNEYNKVLSEKRAKACADYFISKGIDKSRISFESFGECCPLEMEIINGRDNPDGRSRNRRALIHVQKE